MLINQAVEVGIEIIPVPGVSSLMTTLSVLDFKLDKFYFAGFLPREKEQRKSELNSLKSFRITSYNVCYTKLLRQRRTKPITPWNKPIAVP